MAALQEVLAELEAFGTEQNRTVYKRHGASDNLYGVSYANLNKLKKQIKRDHDLARELWATGNHDARILAMMIADPKQATGEQLDAWVHDLGDYMVSDALSGYVQNTAFVEEKILAWTPSDDEWISTTGWNLLGYLALKRKDLSDDYFVPYLDIIERTIHTRKNRVRYAMNNALIAIGCRNDALAQKAAAAAAAIGEVVVDHGETNCQTPNAAAYIEKTRARQRERAR